MNESVNMEFLTEEYEPFFPIMEKYLNSTTAEGDVEIFSPAIARIIKLEFPSLYNKICVLREQLERKVEIKIFFKKYKLYF